MITVLLLITFGIIVEASAIPKIDDNFVNSTSFTTNNSERIKIDAELNEEILKSYDVFENDFQQLLKTYDYDYKGDTLLQNTFSNINTLANPIGPLFKPRKKCTISIEELENLKAAINKTLSSSTSNDDDGETNCDLDSTGESNKCKEYLKYLKCGVDNLKDAYVRATSETVSLGELMKLQNAYDELEKKFRKLEDNVKRQENMEFQKKYDKLLNSYQKLMRSFNKIVKKLKENTKLLCISELGHGKIDSALEHYKYLTSVYYDNDLLREIIKTAHAESKGELVRVYHIIKFICKLRSISEISVGLEQITKIINKISPASVALYANVYFLSIKNKNTFDSVKFELKRSVEDILDSWANGIRTKHTDHILNFIDVINEDVETYFPMGLPVKWIIERTNAGKTENIESILSFIPSLRHVNVRLVAYTFLLDEMKSRKQLDHYTLMMLAYDVHYLEKKFPTDKGKLEELKDKIPLYALSLVWTASKNCTIKNIGYDEYLYVDDIWDGKDASAKSYAFRPPYTWRHKVDFVNVKSNQYWKVTSSDGGKSFQLIHLDSGGYLTALDEKLAYDGFRRNVRLTGNIGDSQFWKIHLDPSLNYFIIRSLKYDLEYLFTGDDFHVRNSDSRMVFTWRKLNETPTKEGHWNIHCH